MRYSSETIAKAIALRAAGKTQIEVAKLLSIDPRTVRKFEKLQSTPIGIGEGDPAKAREEWFKILTCRIRIAAATENDAAISELIKAGAALLNAPDPTSSTPSATEETAGKPTREDVKAIKPTVIRIPAGGR